MVASEATCYYWLDTQYLSPSGAERRVTSFAGMALQHATKTAAHTHCFEPGLREQEFAVKSDAQRMLCRLSMQPR